MISRRAQDRSKRPAGGRQGTSLQGDESLREMRVRVLQLIYGPVVQTDWPMITDIRPEPPQFDKNEHRMQQARRWAQIFAPGRNDRYVRAFDGRRQTLKQVEFLVTVLMDERVARS